MISKSDYETTNDMHHLKTIKPKLTINSKKTKTVAEKFRNYSLLVFLGILFILPFLWMLSTSLKDDIQVYQTPPIWIPSPLRFSNYPEALTFQPFGLFFRNTLFIAIPSVIGGTISSALAAYSMSRLDWKGRDTLFFITIATMLIPFQVQMIPLFLIFKEFGWLNTFLPIIVPAMCGWSYFIFLLRQFFMGIPQEISDAARVDGCSEFQIFLQIILPLSRPALAVVALFIFLWAWGDYLQPLVFLTNRSLYPISLGLNFMRNSSQSMMRLAWPYLMAASTTMVLPALILHYVAQSTFVEGISLTGVKG